MSEHVAVNRSRMLWWVLAGLMVFLIPGLVRHVHRYQQMEAMLQSQARASQWAPAKPHVQLASLAVQKKPNNVAKPVAVQAATSVKKTTQSGPMAPEASAQRPVPNHGPSKQPTPPQVSKPSTSVPPQNKKALVPPHPPVTKTPMVDHAIEQAVHKVDLSHLEHDIDRAMAKHKTLKPVAAVEAKTVKPVAVHKSAAALQVGVFANAATIKRLLTELKHWGYRVHTEPLGRNHALQRVVVDLDDTSKVKALKAKLWRVEKVRAKLMG